MVGTWWGQKVSCWRSNPPSKGEGHCGHLEGEARVRKGHTDEPGEPPRGLTWNSRTVRCSSGVRSDMSGFGGAEVGEEVAVLREERGGKHDRAGGPEELHV